MDDIWIPLPRLAHKFFCRPFGIEALAIGQTGKNSMQIHRTIRTYSYGINVLRSISSAISNFTAVAVRQDIFIQLRRYPAGTAITAHGVYL